MGTSLCITSATWTAGGGGGGGGGLRQAKLASGHTIATIRAPLPLIGGFMASEHSRSMPGPGSSRRALASRSGVTRCQRAVQLCGGTTATSSPATAKALARSVKRAPPMTTTDEQLDDSVTRDEALVERARGGSGAAFAALVARYREGAYPIAMNTALEHRQRHRRRPSLSLEAFLPAFDREGRPVVSQGRWFEIDRQPPEPFEITGLLREALECIDDRVRAAFVLRDLVQLLAEEAAAILQTSPQAVLLDAH